MGFLLHTECWSLKKNSHNTDKTTYRMHGSTQGWNQIRYVKLYNNMCVLMWKARFYDIMFFISFWWCVLFPTTCKNIYHTAQKKPDRRNKLLLWIIQGWSDYMFSTKPTLISFFLAKTLWNASKCKHGIKRTKIKKHKRNTHRMNKRKKVWSRFRSRNFRWDRVKCNRQENLETFHMALFFLSFTMVWCPQCKYLSLFLHHSLLQFGRWPFFYY